MASTISCNHRQIAAMGTPVDREKVLEQVNRGKYVLSEAVQAYIKHVEGGV
ncbi:hypothetical protein P7H22_26155 [Paenibacillus larvae]|nr:hypothetical protein [Paenibacillus larvae]MDT2243115.1 hypothetical protein [Paenibacillus larvae]